MAAEIADVDEPTVAEETSDAHDGPVLVEDVLVEEISIDGMCGVY
jgi:mycofactocin precursor